MADGDGQTEQRGGYIGRPLRRFEDVRLVRGAGQYTDDVAVENPVYAAFVRSPYAHALIKSIDASAARSVPGVAAVLSGAEYLADGCKGIGHLPVPADTIQYQQPAFGVFDGRAPLDVPQVPLAVDRVRYSGEAVAVVIADTPQRARDAADMVAVDWQELPAVADVLAAVQSNAPLVWPERDGNVVAEGAFGNREATRQAFEHAAVVVEHTFRSQRIVNAQLEPRSAIGCWDAAAERYTMIAGSQGVTRQRSTLAAALNVPLEQVRVVCPDVGGGFGPRTALYPEQVVVTWAARRLGRPVRWTSTRSEAFLTDFQGRDSVATARLALDEQGRLLGLEVDFLFNVGGQTGSYVPLSNAGRIVASVYHLPAAHVRVRGVATNTVPTGPFRGAGRPEAMFVLERLLDLAARRMGLDRLELRRRNLIQREQLPYATALGLTYDSGDFAGNMATAARLADWDGFAARRQAARARNRLAGIGLANYVEAPVGAPHERVNLTVLPDGSVEMVVGTQSTGQGHETSFAQVVADQLGVTPEQVRLRGGDTDVVVSGGGTHSDRSLRFVSTIAVDAAAQLIGRGCQIAAALLEVAPEDVAYADGRFQVRGTDRGLGLADVARAAQEDARVPEPLRGPLRGEAAYTGRIPAHPTGCAVCELEVDPETGRVELTRYTAVDDVGQPINPLILHGQVHGGITQGVGQALLEGVAYDEQSGQALNGSFMDYALPKASVIPPLSVTLAEDPTSGNPLRVKGGGESGITPSLAAVVNAAVDALSGRGVTDLTMPLTSEHVWRALQDVPDGTIGWQ